MYLLYVVLAVLVIAGLVKFWPVIATKIPKGGVFLGRGTSGGGMEEDLVPASLGDNMDGSAGSMAEDSPSSTPSL